MLSFTGKRRYEKHEISLFCRSPNFPDDFDQKRLNTHYTAILQIILVNDSPLHELLGDIWGAVGA